MKTKGFEPNEIAMCLQGGGAMGAYQVGVIKALIEAKYQPTWFVGTSIGAINSAIAAGNHYDDIGTQLTSFWESITHQELLDYLFGSPDIISKQLHHYLSANRALLFGQPNFFHPKGIIPYLYDWLNPATSYYNTEPLRDTLCEYVDFDRINKGTTRLSVGAVAVDTGKMVYFDSATQTIGPEHIMASGALPPGFPSVEVDGKHYWDGGLSSNSPVDYVLHDNNQSTLLCL